MASSDLSEGPDERPQAVRGGLSFVLGGDAGGTVLASLLIVASTPRSLRYSLRAVRSGAAKPLGHGAAWGFPGMNTHHVPGVLLECRFSGSGVG